MPNDSSTVLGLYKHLSKKEFFWFFMNIMLLLAAIALSICLLIFALLYTKTRPAAPSNSNGKSSIKETRQSYSSFTIPLPAQERNGFSYQCTGSLISKNYILTSSPCTKNVKYVNFKGKKYVVEKTYESKIHNTKFPNFTIIERADLKLDILKISGNLEAAGLSVIKLPPLNYQVIYRGFGNILYENKEKTQVRIIDFVHPFFCHLVYENHMHLIDFNLMICAITEYESRTKSKVQICLKDAIGGPIIQNGIMVGVLSLSMMDTCGEPKNPFVFINIIPFLQWFETQKILYL